MEHCKHAAPALVNYLTGVGGENEKRSQANILEFGETGPEPPVGAGSVGTLPLSLPLDQGGSRARRPSYLIIAADGALPIQRGTLQVGESKGKCVTWTPQGLLWPPLCYPRTGCQRPCLLMQYQVPPKGDTCSKMSLTCPLLDQYQLQKVVFGGGRPGSLSFASILSALIYVVFNTDSFLRSQNLGVTRNSIM